MIMDANTNDDLGTLALGDKEKSFLKDFTVHMKKTIFRIHLYSFITEYLDYVHCTTKLYYKNDSSKRCLSKYRTVGFRCASDT